MSIPATQVRILRPADSRNGSDASKQNLLQERRWYKRFLPQWEDLIVAGREVKGWVVPQSLGVALLVVILGSVATIYWRMSDKITAQDNQLAAQNELLIRLDQRLQDKSERDREFRQEVQGKFESVMAWQEVTNKTLAQMHRN